MAERVVMPKCNHLEPHEILPPSSHRDAWIKNEMRKAGWFNAGYCESYYPEWCYREWGKTYDAAHGTDHDRREYNKPNGSYWRNQDNAAQW